MSKVIVIGGGPAGMFAAIAAAECGHEVTLLEKNEKLGKKLFITGKGRCNITNASDMDNLFSSVMTNSKFLYSAFYAYDNERVIDFFETNGLPTKVERGNRVFPVSDHSSDVIATLQKVLRAKQVQIKLHTEVAEVLSVQDKVTGVRLKSGETLPADDVIVATGGFSYQTTGSTGDGYRFARELGHSVTEITPSLVPFYAKEDYVPKDAGSFAEKRACTHLERRDGRRGKDTLRRIRRDAVYPLRGQRSVDTLSERSNQAEVYRKGAGDGNRLKTGAFGGTIGCARPA